MGIKELQLKWLQGMKQRMIAIFQKLRSRSSCQVAGGRWSKQMSKFISIQRTNYFRSEKNIFLSDGQIISGQKKNKFLSDGQIISDLKKIYFYSTDKLFPVRQKYIFIRQKNYFRCKKISLRQRTNYFCSDKLFLFRQIYIRPSVNYLCQTKRANTLLSNEIINSWPCLYIKN